MSVPIFDKKIIAYDEYLKVDELFKFSLKGNVDENMKNITKLAISEINNYTFGRLFFQVDKHASDDVNIKQMILLLKNTELKLQHVEEILPNLFDVNKNTLTEISFEIYKNKFIKGYVPSEWYPYLSNNGVVDGSGAREKLKNEIYKKTI